MDSDRFDQLTQSFADLRARRGILKSVAAGLAGIAGLSSLSLGSELDAEAKRRRKKGKKKKGKGKKKKKKNDGCKPDCEGKTCGAKNGCGGKCNSGTCPNALQTCQKGSCICPTQCCENSDCPTGGNGCQPNGACNCGECCFDEDCPPNEICTLIGDTRFCFPPQP